MNDEKVHLQLERIRSELKVVLRGKKYNYSKLADMTGFSLLKVRRLLSSQDFKLGDLLIIANALGVSVLNPDLEIKGSLNLSHQTKLKEEQPKEST